MIPRRVNLDELPQTTQQMAHSKIYRAIRRDIISSMVLIDRRRCTG